MASRLALHCVKTNSIDSSQIYEAPMVTILIGTHWMLLKCSEQLAKYLLIQPNATNTIMMVIGALV
jgi:hypothetical protein